MSDVKIGLVHDFFGTSSGDHAHTDSNFGGASPLAALLMKCRGTVLNTPAAHAICSIGAAESATQGDLFCITNKSQDGVADTSTHRRSRDTEAAELLATAGSRDGWTDFGPNAAPAFSNNTVTWDVTNTYDSDYGAVSLLFGGADLNIKVGTLTLAAEDSETLVTVTGGMENGVLLLFATDSDFSTASTGGSTTFRLLCGMGSYDGTTFRQASISLSENQTKAAGAPAAYLHDDRIMNRSDGDTGALVWSLQWTTGSSTQFGVTTRDGTPSSNDVGYIAIGLPSDWNATVSVEDTPTGAISNPYTFSPAGGSGWTPKILIQILTLMEAVDTAKVDNQAGGLGFRWVIGTGSDDEYCVALNIEDAAATTNTESGIHDSGFLNEDDGGTGYEMDLNGFISGGWKDDFVNVMGNAKKTICLVMGQDDAAGTNRAKYLPLLGVA